MKNTLKEMFTEHWKYLAVRAASELRLFDKISEGQDSIAKLVTANNWNSKSLNDLIHFLIKDAYLLESENQFLSVTEKGELLKENNPESLLYASMIWSGEHLKAWQNLGYSIITGKSSFEHIFRKPYFDYLNDHPEKLHQYHQAMYEYARDDYKELPVLIDFGVHKAVMDVGGGYGAAISLIQNKFSSTKCYIFDLEKVVRNINQEKIEKIAGNFFEGIPCLADAVILSRVLHDWSNEKAIFILQNCLKALPSGGTLYVIENCMDKVNSDFSLLSLNMAVMCQSFERSSAEYIGLCESVGFRFCSDRRLNPLQTILIFNK